MSQRSTPDRSSHLPAVNRPTRILVVKPCCLGDVLMATPALRALQHAFPDAAIDVAVTAWAAPALDSNRRVRRLVRYPDGRSPAAVARLGFRLRREGYDLGIALDRSPLPGLLLWLAGVPVRAGIERRGRRVLLTHHTRPREGQHETELYLDVLRGVGVEPQGLWPEYDVPNEARARIAALLGERGIDGGRPLVVIHPGGAVNPGATMLAKRWPAERFAALADRLAREWGAAIVLTGSVSDRDAVRDVRRAAQCPLVDLSERLLLPELAALCAVARLFVGNDSGVSHLAAAVGAPTVTVFGPTNPLQYRPLGPDSQVCAPPASWRQPTGVDLRRSHRGDPACDVRRVTVDEVYQACARVLGRVAAGR